MRVRRPVELLNKVKTPLRWWLGLSLCGAGIGHFAFADFFLEIMPDWIPFHAFCVYASGVAEFSLGVGLQIPKTRRLAAWGIIALLIAVFPANINMAVTGQTSIESLPAFAQPSRIGLWLRLPMQFVMGAWAWWYTRENAAGARPTAAG